MRWDVVPGAVNSGPAALVKDNGGMDLFAQGLDGTLWRRTWDGVNWTPWTTQGGQMAGDPAVTSCHGGNGNAVVLGMDSQLYSRLLNGPWTGWQTIGGPWRNEPAALCLSSTKTLVIFEVTDDGSVEMLTMPSN
jgi:hypothetical protein